MRKTPAALLAAIVLLASGPGWVAQAAAPDERLVAPALGNRIVSTHPDGRRATLWLQADHSYRAQGRKGERSSGLWSMSGDKVCLSQRKPHRGPLRFCKPLRPMKLGMVWREKAFNGEPVTNRLLAGR